jgi:hypothetical protein
MKKINDDIKNIINSYWNTLITKNIVNIPKNKFIKKPYIENYIIKLSVESKNDILINNILELIKKNKIKNDHLILFITSNFDLNIEQKKYITKFFNNLDITIINNNQKFIIETIMFQIYFFRFYLTIIELLYDNDDENNELYKFILIFIKNKKYEINKYNDNINFCIFYNLLQELLVLYKNLINKLIDIKMFNEEIDDNTMVNLFIKNIFSNWYIIYKKDLIENKIDTKIDKRSIISKILCLPNL